MMRGKPRAASGMSLITDQFLKMHVSIGKLVALIHILSRFMSSESKSHDRVSTPTDPARTVLLVGDFA